MNDVDQNAAGGVAPDAASLAAVKTALVSPVVAPPIDEGVNEGLEDTKADLKGGEVDVLGAIVSKEAAFKRFIANRSAPEILASIEEGAKYLLKLIEAIPPGVAHGWHSLGAEITSRKL